MIGKIALMGAALLIAGEASARCNPASLDGTWDYIALEHIPFDVDEEVVPEFSAAEFCGLQIENRIIANVTCGPRASDFPNLVETELEAVEIRINRSCRFSFTDAIPLCRYLGTLSRDGLTGSGVALCADGTRIAFDLVKR